VIHDTNFLEKKIISAIKKIYDPEIPVNIYELGLIYDIAIDENKNVTILMTLTSPNCPVADTLPEEVAKKIESIHEVHKVRVDLTFEPSWNSEMMSEEAKLELGIL
jgi:FeS assembly SUF system protein